MRQSSDLLKFIWISKYVDLYIYYIWRCLLLCLFLVLVYFVCWENNIMFDSSISFMLILIKLRHILAV